MLYKFINKTYLIEKTHLNARVRAQVEIEFVRVTDPIVHSCTCWNVEALSFHVSGVPAKQSGVVAFLNRYERDARLVSHFKVGTGGSDGPQLF